MTAGDGASGSTRLGASEAIEDRWVQALIERHTAALTRSEFLKAVRALSARYVERRGQLPDRSPLDSAGKRAAFAAFYAPMHFFTTRAVLRALHAGTRRVDTITDLGCGTGVAGAAWALECQSHPPVLGADVNNWALEEARWNWRALDVTGRTQRADIAEPDRLIRKSAPAQAGIIAGWAINELRTEARDACLKSLHELAAAGASVVILEPIASSLVPWWSTWGKAFETTGGSVDEWKLPVDLPAVLLELDEAAGFRRDALSARSISFNLR